MAVLHQSHVMNKLLNDYYANTLAFQDSKKDKEVVIQYQSPAWKLNTDGGFKNGNRSRKRRAVGGGVVRDADGSWVAGFSIKLKVTDAAEADVRTMRYGMEFMKALNIVAYDLEVDAEKIIKIFEENEDLASHKLGPILLDMAYSLDANDQIQIMYSPLTTNRVAHGLADFAVNMRTDRFFHDTPPLVQADFEGDLRSAHH